MLHRRLRYWLDSARREAALREEMELHLEEAAAELRAGGMSNEAAQAEARRRFGIAATKQEESREVWIARLWQELFQDLRYGLRMLLRQPGFTLAAVLALVVGIGVNAIVFNVYNALALAPYAIRDAGQTVQVLSERGGRWSGVSWPHYRYLRDHSQTLEGLIAHNNQGVRIRRGEESWNGLAVVTSENFFSVIGTGFALGRGFTQGSGNNKPMPEAVLHYDAWIGRFGGDPRIIGQWIELSGHPFEVVGVAAPGFSGPMVDKPQLWIPGGWSDILVPGMNGYNDADSCCVSVLGRLKPGGNKSSVQAELSTLSTQFLDSVKHGNERVLLTGPSFLANPSTFAKASAVFLVLGVASLLILLLACANVANLQLARATVRQREIAVRMSLGAGRGRILRQLVVEGLLLSVLAGAASLLISAWAPEALMRIVTAGEANLSIRFGNDIRVAAFIAAMTLVTAIVFGLAPAIGAVRASATGGLREGGRATGKGRLRSALLMAQVALCAILVSGTSLLVRAAGHVSQLDTGMKPEKVVVFETGLDASGLNDEQARSALVPLAAQIASLPGVEQVAHATVVPFGNVFNGTSIRDPHSREQVKIGISQISANFFDALGIPLVAGRAFTRAEESRLDVVVLNEAAAERLWPGESPLGKSIEFHDRQAEVTGVAKNIGVRGFGSEKEPYVWVPSRGSRGSRLLIRHAGDAPALLAALPQLTRNSGGRLLGRASLYSEMIGKARRTASTTASIAGVLGGMSLLLACVGIYGVAAFNVTQRTREVGVRMALGARPMAIVRLVLSQNLRTVLAGATLGIAGAIGFGQVLKSLLYGVKPADPRALLATAAVLLAASALATWGPARRASRVDPAVTLRHD